MFRTGNVVRDWIEKNSLGVRCVTWEAVKDEPLVETSSAGNLCFHNFLEQIIRNSRLEA